MTKLKPGDYVYFKTSSNPLRIYKDTPGIVISLAFTTESRGEPCYLIDWFTLRHQLPYGISNLHKVDEEEVVLGVLANLGS